MAASSSLLHDLKAELAAYKQSTIKEHLKKKSVISMMKQKEEMASDAVSSLKNCRKQNKRLIRPEGDRTVKDSEKLAIAATKALRESESDSHVDLLLWAAVNSQIDMAKESELRSLTKLEELNKELAERSKLLKDATEKAEKANEGKLGVEQELRKWRADQEKQRKASEVPRKDKREQRIQG
ncbi:protein WEAK CHLOROPLAST MOVEMENT UNDER BLUE LIGHT 1-like [Senna tora]|uniref:Protein WEAK CHLOROPLAST MOVEMENT UNDER BLUE LIGHT 1-like n=1 Tax=Senna tora TaxID=362788 RepID=A0A834TXQ9_9FABA|nr:protein WEAK CHLOROPLAST MOVEMENT UNDER BLUE LIGHT 1-like [Senna tora]